MTNGIGASREAHHGSQSIAVVGMGCWYPGAVSPRELWENVLARRRQFRRMPDERLPLAEYYDPDPKKPDLTYGKWAAVLDGYEFDWVGRRIPKTTYEATDIAHWLALDTALQMLADAGYDSKRLPRQGTQVIVGNTLTGEFTRSNTLRLRWPFVRKCLHLSAAKTGLPEQVVAALEEDMESIYKSAFAPVTEDTLAGGLANTIAGRITNYLDLNGGCYTVDGACCSSLLAVYHGAASLAAGTADFVIAGGVDISLDPFELIGFAKTGALTATQMRVYDRRGNGFIPGEGCGFVGLKRLADAERDGDKIYAILDGWGMSSDGRGGLTAPSVAGQRLALERAYTDITAAGEIPDFIEGHGTGTTVGDRVELSAIGAVVGARTAAGRQCGVTSFKSIMGHTKAAAGIGAFMKGVMAVNRRVLPPTAGCEIPHEVFDAEGRTLYPLLQGEVRAADAVMRAGVSAMGFGGINVHVTVRTPQSAPQPSLEPVIEERAALASSQDSEVFVFSNTSVAALARDAEALSASAEKISIAEMADLSAMLCTRVDVAHPIRAAVVASTQEELGTRLARLASLLKSLPSQQDFVRIDDEHGIVASGGRKRAEVGFVFPGQGTQQLGMARLLVERFAWARELAAQADQWVSEAGTPGLLQAIYPNLDRYPNKSERQLLDRELMQSPIAQPAIVLASLLWMTYLRRLGFAPSHFLGHSLGELTAFHAVGGFDTKALMQLAAMRGRCMAGSAERPGTMASLGCDIAKASQLLELARQNGYAVIANINAPDQIVVSGETVVVEAVVKLAQAEGLSARLLSVSNAFHSQLMGAAAEFLGANAPVPRSPAAFSGRLISGFTARAVDSTTDLPKYFAEQMINPVQFVAAVTELTSQCKLLLEVGPGKVLSNLIARIASTERSPAAQQVLCVPVESEAEKHSALNWALACAYAYGVDLRWTALHDNRLVRPFLDPSERRFIVNPCERALKEPVARGSAANLVVAPSPEGSAEHIHSAITYLHSYLAKRGRFIADVIKSDIQHAATTIDAVPPYPLDEPVQAASAASPSPPHSDKPAVRGTAAPALAASSSARAALRRAVSELTGFEESRVDLGMRSDDLNLDSIKVGVLLSRVATEMGVAGQLDTGEFAKATLEEIAVHIDALARGTRAPATDSAQTTPQTTLFDAVSRITGFAAAGLTPELRLIDDLNMDSIKVGSLLSQVAGALGITDRVDATQLAGRSLGEIAALMKEALDAGAAAAAVARPAASQQATHALPTWVRGFRVQHKVEARKVSAEAERRAVQAKTVVVVHEASETACAVALERRLSGLGADVRCVEFARVESHEDGAIDHFVAILPRRTDPDASPWSLIEENARRLASVAAQSSRRKCNSIAFVQFGAVSDRGVAVPPGDSPAISGARAFAASLHLERPTANVRVLNFDGAASDEFITRQVCEEVALDARYCASCYEGEAKRLVARVEHIEPKLSSLRPISWSHTDVVLVTGGGKGITAECALGFAKKSGVRMVLVGTTPAAQAQDAGNEIARTLARFEAEGLAAQYYACDITDSAAVDELFEHVQRELGTITGLIHGSGINRPRRCEQVSAAQAVEEIAPKVRGMVNLLAAVDAKALKLVVALGSIIGVTGMPGNSWYAFSNEALDLLLFRYREQHPKVAAITVAYSVWAEVGMGARLGSVERLADIGIAPIQVDQGVDYFLACALREQPSQQVIVAGRLGTLDTWATNRDLPGLPLTRRYVDEVIAYEPNVELVCRARLDLKIDRYLNDHYYRGVYLFPTVFGLEAMAQVATIAASAALPRGAVLEDITLERPIVVDASGALIEIHATVLERSDAAAARRVRVGIRTEQTAFKRDHFACTLVFTRPQAAQIPSSWENALAEPLTLLEPKADLYKALLFQGPMFQRLAAVYDMSSAGSNTAVERGRAERYFDSPQSADTVLGDPSFRDALLQTAQLSEKGQYLPVRIDSIELHDLAGSVRGKLRVRNHILGRQADELLCDVVAYSDDGTVVERLNGYRLKRVFFEESAPTPEDWVNPTQRDQRLLDLALASASHALRVRTPKTALAFMPGLSNMERARRRLSELPLFQDVVRAVAKEKALLLERLEIQWNDAGKPLLSGVEDTAVSLSLSHDVSHCFAVGDDGPQGCDIESVEARSMQEWTALIGAARESVLNELLTRGDTLDVAGTRVWCAIESAKKALNRSCDIQLAIVERHDDAVLLRAKASDDASVDVLTLAVILTRPRQKIVALAVRPQAKVTGGRQGDSVVAAQTMQPASLSAAAQAQHAAATPMQKRGSQGEILTCHRFRIPFKDANSRQRRLSFPIFADWMGEIRELGITGIAGQLVPDFASGHWGMVTNHSDIVIAGDADCLDLIEGRLWISRVHGRANSSIDMHFSWVRIDDEQVEHPVAQANMTTTWVAIKGHGTVELASFPSYLGRFLQSYLPTAVPGQPAPAHEHAPGAQLRAELGGVLYQAPSAPVIEPQLASQVFHTSLEESNLVGNVYFANYYHWQSRLIDRFLFDLHKEYFRNATTDDGDLQCMKSGIQHLREAMPFDEIEVVMALATLHENGIRLHFDFYRVAQGGEHAKLAYGDTDFAWIQKSGGVARVRPLPGWLRKPLMELTARSAATRELIESTAHHRGEERCEGLSRSA